MKNEQDDLSPEYVKLSTALFKSGGLSLVSSANLANMTVASFIAHISRLGIPVIKQTDKEVTDDMDALDDWLKSDSQSA